MPHNRAVFATGSSSGETKRQGHELGGGQDTLRTSVANPLETPAERVASMDAIGVDVHMLSLSPRMHWYNTPAADAPRLAVETNDDIADVVPSTPIDSAVSRSSRSRTRRPRSTSSNGVCETRASTARSSEPTSTASTGTAPESVPDPAGRQRSRRAHVRAPGSGSRAVVPAELSPEEPDRESARNHGGDGQPDLRRSARPSARPQAVFRPRWRVRMPRHRPHGSWVQSPVGVRTASPAALGLPAGLCTSIRSRTGTGRSIRSSISRDRPGRARK